MDEAIFISNLNDFIFCPASIYFHNLYGEQDSFSYQNTDRIQYSVFEIDNSRRMLDNIICDIESKYSKKFDETNSVYIFILSAKCEVKRYGYAKHEEEDILMI